MTWDETNKEILAIQNQLCLLPERKKRTTMQADYVEVLNKRAVALHYVRINLLIEMRKQGKIR